MFLRILLWVVLFDFVFGVCELEVRGLWCLGGLVFGCFLSLVFWCSDVGGFDDFCSFGYF